LAVISALVLFAAPVGAATITDPATGITLYYPDSHEDCSATSDTVIVSGLGPSHRVIIIVFSYESGTWVQFARSLELTPDGNGNVQFAFNYPAWSETIFMYASAEVYDVSPGPWSQVVKLPGKWTITCPPPAGDSGCSPGYWKNHPDAWAPTGYGPGDDFDTTFSTTYFDPDIILGQAVRTGGGGQYRLARQGIAGLLSAAHPSVDYPYTIAEVIALVQGGDADTLERANQLGCPLN
jgi:hypothetical protein